MNNPGPSFSQQTLPARAKLMVRKVIAMRPFGVPETESIMQFAHLGILTCLCNGRHGVETGADRRDFCRACGGQAVATAGHLLDQYLSPAEIRAMTDRLHQAGVRARGLEIPDTIHSLEELTRYLDENGGKKGRKPPRRPNAPIALSPVGSRQQR